jgi:hypothetical protein
LPPETCATPLQASLVNGLAAANTGVGAAIATTDPATMSKETNAALILCLVVMTLYITILIVLC